MKKHNELEILEQFPEYSFPDNLLKVLPNTQDDIKFAVKCLVFEIPAGAVFYMMRILYATVRYYFLVLCTDPFEPENQSMEAYLTKLKDNPRADQSLVEAINLINELPTNPFKNPDINIKIREAIIIFGMTFTALSFLLVNIEKYKNEK